MASPWKSLYAMTWLVTLEFLLAMLPGRPAWALGAHVALGIGLALLAGWNYAAVRGTRVPGRVKRTARSNAQLGAATAILGALVVFGVGDAWTIALGITLGAVILVLHIVLALAVLAQAAAIGISYDMWEEKEFAEDTSPGDVPAMPEAPTASGPRGRGAH